VSSRRRPSSDSISVFTAELSLLTGSPGRSNVTTAMPVSMTVVKADVPEESSVVSRQSRVVSVMACLQLPPEVWRPTSDV
jgi:hypothetical protein